jgi:EAL domain-containing protein (putative c-di-GMP-specific phosphodiesterase class I)
VDEIKIDRSFVRNIVNDKRDMAVVLSTVELCHNLGLIVVAEGVEDALSRELLRRIGWRPRPGVFLYPAAPGQRARSVARRGRRCGDQGVAAA